MTLDDPRWFRPPRPGASRRAAVVAAVLILVLVRVPAAHARDAGPAGPFFAAHCVGCHGPEKAKNKFRVDTLPRRFDDPKAAGHWQEVMDRISSGDMPPADRPRPRAEDAARVVEWIAGQLKAGEAARLATDAPVSFHRLSREEYADTVRDLLGVRYDAEDPTGLPADATWQGFERIGSVLGLSATHVEKYMAVGRTILDQAFPDVPPEPLEVVWNHQVLHGGPHDDPGARVVGLPGNAVGGGTRKIQLRIKAGGEYACRVKLSGLRPAGGRPPRLRVQKVGVDRPLFEQDIEAPEDRPIVVEFRTRLAPGDHEFELRNPLPGPSSIYEGSYAPDGRVPFTTLATRLPWQVKLTDDDGRPIESFLIVDRVTWEGPIPPGGPAADYRRMMADGQKDAGHARSILARFAERAFRRPPTPAEVDRLARLAAAELRVGEPFPAAVKAGMLAVLCSKDFLFLVEGSAGRPGRRLTDWELASRLSYFLWGTMPDDRLFDLARAGTLSRPATLRAEARRMLDDPRAARFVAAFPRQWLQLRKVGSFPPDKTLYPDYDDHLQDSMIQEPIAFFREVLTRNLSIREFLDSDWATVNARLAGHYGIAGVDGDAFRRVALGPEDHRGGLLTQAAVLSQTSDGRRHRPVHRGKWVLESLYGQAPPPPPANVKPIEPTPRGRKKMSLREKLASHTSDASCAACHRKIDPVGLAFEQYDAIGRWRTEEVTTDGDGADPKVDAGGVLPDGRRFADAAGLKRLLAADLDRFAAAFAEKLATFAIRRAPTPSDRSALAAVAAAVEPAGYPLRSLVEELVASDVFRSR